MSFPGPAVIRTEGLPVPAAPPMGTTPSLSSPDIHGPFTQYDVPANEPTKPMDNPLLLIVDDSKMSRMMIARLVGDLRPDWRLAEAADAAEALAMIEHEPPTLVSMDVNMPGMSGLEAAGRIRLRNPDIRVVLCTANIQDAVRQAAEKAGVHFVAKPITPESVSRMVAFFEE